MASWFERIGQKVYREYDRRIKRASLIDSYGKHNPVATAPDEADDDDGASEIANVSRGTMLAPALRPEPPRTTATTPHTPHTPVSAPPVLPAASPAVSHDDDEESGEISNIRPGTPESPRP